ncbi:MAG: NAD-dependent epimerase/dehydratase family protein [Devosia sp.]
MKSPGHVVVTGAAGFVGGALCAELVRRHWTVTGLVRRVPAQKIAGIRYVAADLQQGTLPTLLSDPVDVVVHAAARAHRLNEKLTQPELVYAQANVAMSLALARTAMNWGAQRFIFLSTCGVLGNRTTGIALDESSPANPQTPYAASKLAAEEGLQVLFAEHKQRLVIVRPSLVYGASAPGNFGLLLKLVRSGLPLPFARTDNRRNLLALDNLTDLLCNCLTHPAAGGRTFIATDGPALSTRQIVEALASGMSRPARLFALPDTLLATLARLAGRMHAYNQLTQDLEYSSAKARQLLDWDAPLTPDAALHAVGRAFAAG